MLDGIPLDPNGIGVVGLCVLIVIAFMRGWIVPGRVHDDVKRQRDEALQRAEGVTRTHETILDFLRAIKYGTPLKQEDAP